MKNRFFFFQGLWLSASLIILLLPQQARASYPGYKSILGGESPRCSTCSCSCSCSSGSCGTSTCPSVSAQSNTTDYASETEGNVTATVNVTTVGDPTLNLGLTYNSYNADGSRTTVDTVMGYGWTHSYNIFLFSQLGAMFRFDGDGRITRYAIAQGGGFSAATGYFETLVRNTDGSFTLTKKDKTIYTFTSVSGTHFLVNGPVWPLTKIVDRNGNTTTLTYTGGNLTAVTDTYGRTVALGYNAENHVTSVTDPLGRVTTFQYDSTGHLLTQITDPNGKSIQYTYNVLFQITSKTDKAGRVFNYIYANYLPIAVYDSTGTGPATLSNPNNWATDPTQLAMFQLRVYIPSTTSNTDGRGNVWKYQYDSNGYLTQTTAPDGATTRYTYDPATLQLASKTDADGHTTTYKYDSEGNRIKMTDALGYVTTYTYEPVFNQMTSMTDPRGRTTTYSYDSHGNRTQETDPLGQTRKWTYDSHGNILTDTDKNGHTTTYQYDAFGERIQITDPLGNITRMTYDAVENLISRTDANGHTTTYQYDGMNRLIIQTDPTGHTDQTFYDGEGNRIETIDRDGHSTTYQYDLRQRLIETTDALNQNETYTYDGNDNRVSLTDRNGHTTTYGYDVRNRLNKITDALGDVTTTTYDPVGNVLRQTDADGHTTTYTYDVLNRRATMTDALNEETQYFYDGGSFSGSVRGITCIQCGATPGSSLVTEQIDPDGTAGLHAGVIFFKYDALDRLIIKVQKTGCIGSGCQDTITVNDAITTSTYDPVGNRLTQTEPDGNTTTYQYDADNRRIEATNAAGDVTRTAYDGVSNVTAVTAPNLNVTVNTYDSLDRLIQVVDGVGLVSAHTYDPAGNRLSSTDGNRNTTAYGYDALNRVITTTDPLGKTTTSQYDAVGNVLKTTDRNGHATIYVYDAINRHISTIDALGHVTLWQYDPVGNLIKRTDANSHSTTYKYDAVNRPIQETYADGLSRTYTYDKVGNLLTRTDQIGQTTTYTYNDLYFLISRAYPFTGTDTFTYDLSGRMLTNQRGSWPVTFTYDGADRIVQTVQNSHTIDYSYNIPGRIRTITYPGGRLITEHTDARARMDYIDDINSPPSIVQYSYDLDNNVLGRNYRNGTMSASKYNANDWILSLQHSHGSTLIAGFDYAYDNEGNKNYEQKLQNPTHSEGYQYDNTYRLIDYKVGTLVMSQITMPITQTSYNLDPVGNWNSKTTDMVTQTRVHNAVNELIKIDTTNLIYDANGNLRTDATYTYAYDEENRLTKVTRNADSAVVGQYQYDALSRRVQKIADPAGTATTTIYLYDSTRIVEEQNSLNATQATYVYGNYVDEVLTMDRGGQTYYYHQNALWSVEAVTDSTGTAAERYSYDAYGYVTVTTGTGVSLPLNPWGTPYSAIGNPYVFTGRQMDEETGLYFYRARYYDPRKGRFLQRDPFGYVDGMNLYEYAKSNPDKYADPGGTLSVWLLRKKLSADGAGCGDEHYIEWDFELDKPAPCDGYIVQQIDIYETRKNCVDCPDKAPEAPTTRYWEAWWVAKGGTLQELRGRARGGIGPATYTDRATNTPANGTCGVYNVDGTIKFFCKDSGAAIGALIGVAVGGVTPRGPVTGGITGALVGAAIRPGTGDLGKENEAPASPGSDWGPNKNFNGTTPGWLPATDKKPPWWDGTPIEGPARRRMTNSWCCCPGRDSMSRSDGSPIDRKPAQ